MFHFCFFFVTIFALFAFKEMAADAASCLTTRCDDLACSYQTCCKVTTFTYCFLVTDLATLTGSCVERFKNPKMFRCGTQTLNFKPRHPHCMVCLARHWRVRSLVPLAGKILKSRTRNQPVRSLVPLAGKILKWKTSATVKF